LIGHLASRLGVRSSGAFLPTPAFLLAASFSGIFQGKNAVKLEKIPLTQYFYAHSWCLSDCSVNKDREFGSIFTRKA
jgi:hypothetical protein